MKAMPYINPQGPIARAILLPEDPLHARFIAETYLEDAQQFSSMRNMLGFADYYQGTQMFVMGSSMGTPSISLYAWELIHVYDCGEFVCTGTYDSLQPEASVFDVVIAQVACPNSNFINQYNPPGAYAPIGSSRLAEAMRERAKVNGVTSHVGNILSSDTFYSADPSFSDRWAKMGTITVEMGAAGLYTTAADVGIEVLGIFTVSDFLVIEGVATAEQYQTALTDTMELALPLT